jgi:hypothetical protein
MDLPAVVKSIAVTARSSVLDDSGTPQTTRRSTIIIEGDCGGPAVALAAAYMYCGLLLAGGWLLAAAFLLLPVWRGSMALLLSKD